MVFNYCGAEDVIGAHGSYRPKWDRLNHDWAGGRKDGYAVCANCLCKENTLEAADVCWKGPAIEHIRQQMRANIEESKKDIPEWMQKVFDDNPVSREP